MKKICLCFCLASALANAHHALPYASIRCTEASTTGGPVVILNFYNSGGHPMNGAYNIFGIGQLNWDALNQSDMYEHGKLMFNFTTSVSGGKLVFSSEKTYPPTPALWMELNDLHNITVRGMKEKMTLFIKLNEHFKAEERYLVCENAS